MGNGNTKQSGKVITATRKHNIFYNCEVTLETEQKLRHQGEV